MTLVISYSPYTFSNPLAQIKFHTNISIQDFISHPASFPEIPTTESTMHNILPILNRIIVCREAGPFLRPVDPIIDKAPDYPKIITNPIDLSEILEKTNTHRYHEFSEFTADLQLLIKNATLYNPKNHPIHKNALELSGYINKLLVELKNSPKSTIMQSTEYENKLTEQASTQIADALTNSYQLRRRIRRAEQEAEAKERSKRPLMQEQIPDRFIKELENKIRRMSGTALITVIEIIEKKAFQESFIPYTIDLKKCDNETIHNLNLFADDAKDSKSSKIVYVGRPSIPDDLQEIQTKYKNELTNWLKPPPSKSNQ